MLTDAIKETLNMENNTMTDQEKPVVADTVKDEFISPDDKLVLDKSTADKEKALLTAKLAISQSETLEMNHNNIVLRLALKYSLRDGDTIDNTSGQIKRK